MEGRGHRQATSESGEAGGGVGGGDAAAATAEYSVANRSSTISNANVSSSKTSSAGNLQLRKRAREAVYEPAHVVERMAQNDVGRRYEEQAPPMGAADPKQAAQEHLAHEPRRQPYGVSEAANAATTEGEASPGNDTVPDPVSSVEEERALRAPRIVSETAHDGGVIPADTLAGAHQASSAARAPALNRAVPKRRYRFSIMHQLANQVANRQDKPRRQDGDVVSTVSVSPADVVSAETIQALIRYAGTSKMVIGGSNLAREHVFGLLVVHPLMYMVDPAAARAVAVFASEEDAHAAWNHVTSPSKPYGLNVKVIFPRGGSLSCDLP